MKRKPPASVSSATKPGLDRARLQRPLRSLREALGEISSDPSSESVHAIRGGTRKLETMIQALSIEEVDSGFTGSLNKLRKRAGGVRDLDVIAPFAASLALDDMMAPEQNCHAQLMETLTRNRRRESRRLYRWIRRHGEELSSGIRELSRMIEAESRPDRDSDTLWQWNESAEATAKRIEDEISQDLRGSQLHNYRKKVRELRFLLRLRKEVDGQFAVTLGEVRDSIGLWHDWTLLQEAAEAISTHPAECQILRLITSTQQRKLDAAVSSVMQLRSGYLDPEIRFTVLSPQFAA